RRAGHLPRGASAAHLLRLHRGRRDRSARGDRAAAAAVPPRLVLPLLRALLSRPGGARPSRRAVLPQGAAYPDFRGCRHRHHHRAAHAGRKSRSGGLCAACSRDEEPRTHPLGAASGGAARSGRRRDDQAAPALLAVARIVPPAGAPAADARSAAAAPLLRHDRLHQPADRRIGAQRIRPATQRAYGDRGGRLDHRPPGAGPRGRAAAAPHALPRLRLRSCRGRRHPDLALGAEFPRAPRIGIGARRVPGRRDARATRRGAVTTIPGERGHWLWGSAHALARAPHIFPAELGWRFGGLASFRVLYRRVIAVTDADLARQILVTRQERYRRSFHARNARAIVGNGLLSTDGATWLSHRRQMLPAFHHERLMRLGPIVREATLQLLESWEAQRRQAGTVALAASMQALAIAIMGQALLSTRLDSGAAARFGAAVRDSLTVL